MRDAAEGFQASQDNIKLGGDWSATGADVLGRTFRLIRSAQNMHRTRQTWNERSTQDRFGRVARGAHQALDQGRGGLKTAVDAFDKVACPHCGRDFVLQDAITQQLIERYEAEYSATLEGERRALRESLLHDAERTAAKLPAANQNARNYRHLRPQLQTSNGLPQRPGQLPRTASNSRLQDCRNSAQLKVYERRLNAY